MNTTLHEALCAYVHTGLNTKTHGRTAHRTHSKPRHLTLHGVIKVLHYQKFVHSARGQILVIGRITCLRVVMTLRSLTISS